MCKKVLFDYSKFIHKICIAFVQCARIEFRNRTAYTHNSYLCACSQCNAQWMWVGFILSMDIFESFIFFIKSCFSTKFYGRDAKLLKKENLLAHFHFKSYLLIRFSTSSKIDYDKLVKVTTADCAQCLNRIWHNSTMGQKLYNFTMVGPHPNQSLCDARCA